MSKFMLDVSDDIMEKVNNSKDIIEEKEKKMARTVNMGITSNEEIFIPEIHPNDDVLNRIVKEILIDKKISLKTLPFANNQEQFNFKRSLRVHQKMSIQKFDRWMELLGVDWSIKHNYEFKTKNSNL